MKIPEPKYDYEVEHNKEHEAFLELISDLQDKAESFPVVEEPMPGCYAFIFIFKLNTF